MIYIRSSVVITFILCTAVCITSLGCRSTYETRTAIRNSLSGKGVSVHDQQIVRQLGGSSIPLVYDEIRRSSSDWRIYRGSSILIGISRSKDAQPSAPYIRRVLDDASQPLELRLMSAKLLMWYSGSKAVRDALITHAKKDADISVRIECVQDLGGWYIGSIVTHRCTSDSTVQNALAELSRDKAVVIRMHAYKVIGNLGNGRHAVWAGSMLRIGLNDKSKVVRKAVIQSIADVQQEERRLRQMSK